MKEHFTHAPDDAAGDAARAGEILREPPISDEELAELAESDVSRDAGTVA
jgi:hypothetical protein